MAAFRKIFFLLICLASVMAKLNIEGENAPHTVCRNVRIWNLSGQDLANEIKALQKCQIIEGYLDIRDVTLDSSTSFPKLVQVTDYVVLYFVEGVTSVAELFPLLSVIRGRNLFYNIYGLVLIDNHDFREIGSWSLKVIKRGAIRLESNAIMCINSRAELDRITHMDYHDRLVLHKNYYLCPFEDCMEENWCTAPERTCKVIGCYEDNECHEECLGGCKCQFNSSCCAACKHFLMENKCVLECPKDHLTYMQYRCITAKQCQDYGWAILKNSSYQEGSNDRCIKKCPNGFVKRNMTGICEPRQVNDWCDGATLTNTYLGSNLKGCSVINGNLIIMVTAGKNVTRQLEENLAKLENITGYLRVVGSNALLSLNILKNLKNIQGKEVATNGCVLCVFENSNLEELWNWKSRDTKLIINGNPYVAFNDRLCPSKVKELLKETNLTSNGAVILSNGKYTDCNILFTPLTAIAGNTPGTVNLSFYHNWCGVDGRTFVGYGVYYRESLSNISIYEGRDTCSKELWKMKFFEMDFPHEGVGMCFNTLSLENLKPNTRYAIYAESFSADNTAVHTDLAYVTTYPLRPSTPGSGSIKVIENNLLISIEETINPSLNEGFYEIVINLKTIKPEKDLRYNGNCPEESIVLIPRSIDEYENNYQPSSNPDSNCFCSSISPESIVMKRKELVAVENEIQRLYFMADEDQGVQERYNDFNLTLATKETENNTTSCDSLRISNRAPPGLCSAPILNWVKDKNDSLMFTVLEERHNWNYSDLSKESSLLVESHQSTQTIAFPLHIKTPAIVEVKVRACLRKMTPCNQLNISSSCALCSNYYKMVTYKAEKNPLLKTFKVTPKVMDETGKELDAIYTDIDCKAEFFDIPDDISKNNLMLEISWDYSAHLGHLVHGFKILYTTAKEINSTCLSKLTADEMENKIQLEVMQPREYKVAIFLKTVRGYELSKEICKHIKIYDIYKELYWVSAAAVCTALLVVFLLAYRNVIQKYPPKEDIVVFKNPYHGDSPDVFLWEEGITVEYQITTDNIQILKDKNLGEGKFGKVCEGYLTVKKKKNLEIVEDKDSNAFRNILKNLMISCNKKNQKNITKEEDVKKVAIKTCLNDDGLEDEGRMNRMKELIEEAKMAMSCNKSEFCVKMYGVYREAKMVYVVYEKMDKSLKEYLQENKEFGLSEILMAEIAIQIADGLAFMGAQNLVHRDIASRNILISIASNGDSIISVRAKISDFGLTRRQEDGYYKFLQSDGKYRVVPVRGVAPEAITEDKYDWRTDVWSFGVLLGEIMHIEKTLFEHINDLRKLCNTDEEKHHHLCLDDIQKPDFLVEIMEKCIQVNPKRRPPFKNIVDVLLTRVQPKFREEFLSLSWYKVSKNIDTNSSEGGDSGMADSSFNASLDEDDQPSSLSASRQPCDDTSFSSLTQEEYSGKNVSCPSL